MAWGTGSSCGAANDKTADVKIQTFIVGGASVGDVLVFLIAKDNAATSNGNTNEVTSITDLGTNTLVKAREFCNARGAAAGGATVAVYYCKVTQTIANNTVATINFSSSTTASAVSVRKFTSSLSSIQVYAGNDSAVTAGAPGSLSHTGPGSECLYIRAIATENSDTTGLTVSGGGFATFDQSVTSGGSAVTNMGIRGEYLISSSSGTVTSNPSLINADHANVFVVLQEVSPDATANGTTLSDTASLIAGTGYVSDNTATGTTLTDTASLIAGTAYGPDATAYGQTLTNTAALLDGQVTATPPLVVGGLSPLRLRLSGGAVNTYPHMSLGGYPSLVTPVSGQFATFSGAPNITGITLREADGNAIGTGTLTYTASTKRLTWQPYGGGYDFVTITGDGLYFVGPLDSYLMVEVVFVALPSTNKTDSIVIAAHPQNIFDDVDYAQWDAGVIEYRGLYIENLTDTLITSLTLRIEAQPSVGSVAMAFQYGDVTYGTLQQDEMETDHVISPVGFNQWYETEATRTNTHDFYFGNGTPFAYAAPTLTLVDNPYSDGVYLNVLPTLADEADSTGVLSGLTWFTTKTLNGFPAGNYLPFWVRRTIPNSTPPAYDIADMFRITLLYY